MLTKVLTVLALSAMSLASALVRDIQSSSIGARGDEDWEHNSKDFCDTVNLPPTNGMQIKTGSCNSVVMGALPSKDKIPTCKFTFPLNFQQIKENESFTITMAIKNLDTGNFVNPNTQYLAAPQMLDNNGFILGHSRVVIQKIPGFQSTEPLDPLVFAFFKGLNDPAVDGILSAPVPNGLPVGFYRLSSLNVATNDQPVIPPIAQRGAENDCVYFEVCS